MPVEPTLTRWQLPSPARAGRGGIAGLGADLEPGTLLAAYRCGLFPMRLDGLRGPLAWWSPDPRGVLPLDRLIVSRSLRRSMRRYTVHVDADFPAVLSACADPARSGAWIDPTTAAAYLRLHELGWAHSLEVRDDAGQLVGGLYGVAVGGLFAGESMFSVATDASKVALVHLVRLLGEDGAPRLLDVQWRTDHLASLGVVAIPRRRYLRLLGGALQMPLPAGFDDGRS